MVLARTDRNVVCKRLGISRTQLYVWLKREKAGEGLKSEAGRGRKPSVHPVAKRVVAMSVTKRRQSTRKLVSGMPGRIRQCVVNEGGGTSANKFHAIAVFSL